METKLRMLEEGSMVKIHLEALKAILKENTKLENPGLDGIHGFWFKNSPPSMTDWLPK